MSDITKKNRALVLMYHNVAKPPKRGGLRSLYVTPLMFKFQMWYLKNNGFKVVPLNDIVAFVNGASSDVNLVSLTFDDGYHDFYDNAYPVLQSYSFPATVFIVSDLAGKHNVWDCNNLGVEKKLADWDSIAEMGNNGIIFGSHTRTHPFLAELSPDEIEDQVRNSKTAIEERLNKPVEFICYPYGSYDGRVLNAVKAAGYLGAATTQRGFVHKGDNPFEIRRSFIRFMTHPLMFAWKLHTDYEDKKGGRL